MSQWNRKKREYLFLLRVPNKTKTISEILKQDKEHTYIVKASVGHITEINNSGVFNMGIDVDNKFKADYQISKDKKDIVKELKEQVKLADRILICSDPDREGEAIAWSLKKFLNIPNDKYDRITFHEITKPAILKALNNPRVIDENLVDAAQSRQKLDKIIGYRLSPIARKELNCKSVGRCQSAGLKLIVQREEEIKNFKPETFFELYLNFKKNKTEFNAKYVGTDKKEIKSFTKKEDVDKVISSCKDNDYIVKDIETKEQLENPKAPFITSTFQQEVSKKLGISIDASMNCAQKLFEGINIGGNHIALTTYLRTDDANISEDFLPVLEKYVKSNYGKEYYSPVKKQKAGDNSQQGHECFRVVDLEMTPEKLSKYINDETLLKVYEIIWKRTVASSMKPAVYSNTQYSIYNKENKFILNSRELVFDGYRKIYNYKDDDTKEEIVKETFNKEEKLKDTKLESLKKETQPPKRYTEASFIKELDKKGIGRPSTFATILKTLLSKDRGYVNIEKKELVPSDKAIELSHFLDKSFGDIINIQYTSELENDLDLIANGKLKDIDFLTTFYSKLEESIKKVDNTSDLPEKICPECGHKLVVRKGKYGPFYGCSNYPNCKHIEKISK